MVAMKKPNRLREAITETAEGMHRLGFLDDGEFKKITARDLGPARLPASDPMTGDEIRQLREQTYLSQAALGRYIGLTPGYVSQLECGTKHAKGPALVLLNVIRRKGIEALL